MQENITTYSKIVALKKKFFPKQLLPDRIAWILDDFFNNLHNVVYIAKNRTHDDLIQTKNMKKVFIDGGARIGETLYMFLEKRPDLLGCDVYFFECNENHIGVLKNISNTNKNYNFIVKQNAVWNKNETKLFYITNDKWGIWGVL